MVCHPFGVSWELYFNTYYILLFTCYFDEAVFDGWGNLGEVVVVDVVLLEERLEGGEDGGDGRLVL